MEGGGRARSRTTFVKEIVVFIIFVIFIVFVVISRLCIKPAIAVMFFLSVGSGKWTAFVFVFAVVVTIRMVACVGICLVVNRVVGLELAVVCKRKRKTFVTFEKI